jgi:hypothetical protein
VEVADTTGLGMFALTAVVNKKNSARGS